MTDEDVVYTIVNDMLEEMELKNGKICDDSNYSCGGQHEMDDDTYSLSDALEKNVMTLIISVGGNMKWMMTLTLCLMPLKKYQR